jgi:hypothetical protein
MNDTGTAPRAKVAPLQAVRGMNDVLPDEAALWERLEATARNVFSQYGYRNIRVPIVEPTRCSCAASASTPTSSRRRCTRSRTGCRPRA